MTSSMETFLNDSWSLYFHDPYNENWDEDSYNHLCNMSSVEEVVQTCESFKGLWNKGMFFLMREHIKPLWEDPYNKNGGCFSFKAMKPEVPKVWKDFVAYVVGETLVKVEHRDQNWTKVCGISISPKRNYCIIRVWISDKTWCEPANFVLKVPSYTSVLFKSHTDHESC
jgi:hypothetical protein